MNNYNTNIPPGTATSKSIERINSYQNSGYPSQSRISRRSKQEHQ